MMQSIPVTSYQNRSSKKSPTWNRSINEPNCICDDTNIVVYLKEILGDVTMDEEHELHVNDIRKVGELKFVDDEKIESFNEFTETQKNKLKIILRYLNLLPSDASRNYLKSIDQMKLFIKHRENQQNHNEYSGNIKKLYNDSSVTYRMSPFKKEMKEQEINLKKPTSSCKKNKKEKTSKVMNWVYLLFQFSALMFLVWWPHILLYYRRKSKKQKMSATPTVRKQMNPLPKKPGQPTETSEVCDNYGPFSNCCCPQMCNDVILDQTLGSFTCRQRIEYLMKGGKKSQREACIVTAQQYPACGNCNPDKCPATVEN